MNKRPAVVSLGVAILLAGAAIITLRSEDYDEVLQIARSSPNLGYGGSVTLRRVGVTPEATSLLGEELYARDESASEVAAADGRSSIQPVASCPKDEGANVVLEPAKAKPAAPAPRSALLVVRMSISR